MSFDKSMNSSVSVSSFARNTAKKFFRFAFSKIGTGMIDIYFPSYDSFVSFMELFYRYARESYLFKISCVIAEYHFFCLKYYFFFLMSSNRNE